MLNRPLKIALISTKMSIKSYDPIEIYTPKKMIECDDLIDWTIWEIYWTNITFLKWWQVAQILFMIYSLVITSFDVAQCTMDNAQFSWSYLHLHIDEFTKGLCCLSFLIKHIFIRGNHLHLHYQTFVIFFPLSLVVARKFPLMLVEATMNLAKPWFCYTTLLEITVTFSYLTYTLWRFFRES